MIDKATLTPEVEAALRLRPPVRPNKYAEPADVMPMEDTFPALDGLPADDDADNHRNAPRPSSTCLYGLIGEVAKAGSETTEANPFAIAANFIAYMSVAVGRGPYLAVGNTWHHARQFTLHVGRSSRGRKGDANALVKRIDRALREIDATLAPQVHAGGLSSREGLAFLIHDGYKDGKEEVPPVLDKRLWVIESEFANILHQSKRDGNTLSAALRDCWDGVSLRPATKTNRLWATDPHIGLSGAVTPSELLGLMASRELTNGFANRFLVFWAEKTKNIPFPEATHQDVVQGLARKVADVLQFVGASRWVDKDVMRVGFSVQARNRYADLYSTELNDTSAGERIAGITERRAPMLLRLAMLFALCDKTNTVEVHHVDVALAWVRYSFDSVRFIFGSAEDEAKTAEVQDTAQKILDYIGVQQRVTRSQITTDCFKGHAPKTRIDAALDDLLTRTPPSIEVHEDRTGKGRPTKFYELAAKYANLRSKGGPQREKLDFEPREVSAKLVAKKVSDNDSGLVRNHGELTSQDTSRAKNTPLQREADTYFATSLTSQAFSKNGEGDTVETEL